MRTLDVASIRGSLHGIAAGLVGDIELFQTLDSTNEHLLRKCRNSPPIQCRVCLADEQTHGRGRRGRPWFSPPRMNLYLSLSWRLKRDLSDVTAVTILLALAAAERLNKLGVPDLQVKWPNDLLCRNRKLAGMLVEACASAGGWNIVVGLGLNIDMCSTGSNVIDQPWID